MRTLRSAEEPPARDYLRTVGRRERPRYWTGGQFRSGSAMRSTIRSWRGPLVLSSFSSRWSASSMREPLAKIVRTWAATWFQSFWLAGGRLCRFAD